MADITVIVSVVNDDEQGLRYTLEGLVEQSTEDFSVLIANACPEMRSLINEYCGEYVGFESFEADASLPVLRNLAAARAEGEYLWFIDCGDYISPESVEKVLETAEKTKADIICPRYYFSGGCEPYYDIWAEQLACAADIDRFDRALLNTLDFDGRVYKKKFFDLYSQSFPDTPSLYNMQFTSGCVLGCGAKISGCTGAIYDRKNGVFSKGFPKNAEPSKAGFLLAAEVFESVLSEIKAIIKEQTGALDGDEYSLQEFIYIYFSYLTDNFYRYFWYLDDETLALLREKYEQLSPLMTSERREKLNKSCADLRFPGMYIMHEDAAKAPLFSLLLDFDSSGLEAFINSLYIQRFPFFEIFIKESLFNSPAFPQRFKNAANIKALPDKNFFAEARRLSAGIPINIKESEPADPRILSELSVTKAPHAMYQYMFSSKRKKYAAKSYLKKKGLAMR